MVVSYSISTSNHNALVRAQNTIIVVSYSISTSNHNPLPFKPLPLLVVSYSISTSNHNQSSLVPFQSQVVSYSISTSNHNDADVPKYLRNVVSYSISTSNHNTFPILTLRLSLYLIPFLHQTTTNTVRNTSVFSCILFHFYIKPQPSRPSYLAPDVVSYSISTSNHNGIDLNLTTPKVVSYSISTSNHNLFLFSTKFYVLYLIPFLHQTTTYGA